MTCTWVQRRGPCLANIFGIIYAALSMAQAGPCLTNSTLWYGTSHAGGEPGAKIQVAMKCYAFGHDDLQSRVRTMVVPFQWL